MVVGPYGRAPVAAQAWKATEFPDQERPPMQSDPFLDFHRIAERAGYPAMLIVSMFALGLVVAPVALLALTRGVWALIIAVVSIFVALALLAGAFGAAVADSDGADPQPAASGPEEREGVKPLPQRHPTRARVSTTVGRPSHAGAKRDESTRQGTTSPRRMA
jgi:hypothetical protein